MAESLRGLRLSRFYNYEGTVYIAAPTGGWNPDANPWELPDNQAPVLDNFIIGPGRISMRGPFIRISQVGAAFEPIGYVIGDVATLGASGWCSMSAKLADASKIIDPWHAPLAGAAAANLASGVLSLKQSLLGSGAGTTTNIAVTADTVIGPRWINFDGLLYGISYDAVAAAVTDTNSNYHMKPLNLLTLPNTQSTATVPTILSNAPHGAFDLKGYLSRVWLLGGIDTPGALTVHEPVTLYYTVPGASGVGTASADWRDPISGLTNKIRLDNNNTDYGVGLALVPNAMLIFRRNSIWILRGTTSSTFQIQPLSKEVGCVDARSIVETDRGVYFISHRGLMLTDGTSVVPVSGSVQIQMESVISRMIANAAGGAGAWASCARTSLGQLLISIGVGNAGASGTMNTIWSGMYDPMRGAWTRITSGIWSSENGIASTLPPMFVSRPERNQLFTVGDLYLVQLEDYANSNGLGRSFLQNDNAKQGFIDKNGGGNVPINPHWRSKFVSVIGTGSRRFAIAKRYTVDYVFGCNPSSGTTGWRVSPLDSSDVAIDTALDVPSQTTTLAGIGIEATPLPRIQRQNVDFTSEIADLSFDVTCPVLGSPQGAWRADIYGIALESQRTRDAR